MKAHRFVGAETARYSTRESSVEPIESPPSGFSLSGGEDECCHARAPMVYEPGHRETVTASPFVFWPLQKLDLGV